MLKILMSVFKDQSNKNVEVSVRALTSHSSLTWKLAAKMLPAIGNIGA